MITSVKNSIIKDILKLKNKKNRIKTGLFYIEGERLIGEVPEDFIIKYYIFSESFSKKVDINRYNNSEKIIVSDHIFIKISDTLNPQGIMAICKSRKYSLNNIKLNGNSFFVLLDRISDPGNLGTIIRTAEALGCNGIFLSKDCVDLYNPKVLRATMGSLFHIPIIEDCDLFNTIDILKEKNIKIICTHLNGCVNPYDVNFKKPIAVLIGNEANGVFEGYVKKSDILVKIPMIGNVESINVSASSAIIFYEILRQKLV